MVGLDAPGLHVQNVEAGVQHVDVAVILINLSHLKIGGDDDSYPGGDWGNLFPLAGNIEVAVCQAFENANWGAVSLADVVHKNDGLAIIILVLLTEVPKIAKVA